MAVVDRAVIFIGDTMYSLLRFKVIVRPLGSEEDSVNILNRNMVLYFPNSNQANLVWLALYTLILAVDQAVMFHL